MLAYLQRRLLLVIPILLAVSLVTLGLMELIPGDPAQALLGPYANEENVAKLRESLALDRPFAVRYVTWLGNLLRGDWGTAYSLDRPVRDEILERLSATLLLAGTAFVVGALLGLGAGMLLAIKRHTWLERVLTVGVLAGISLPSFWLGLLLVLVFAVTLQWLPASGMTAILGDGGMIDRARHLLLPALTLALVGAAVLARLMRTQMLDVLHQGYIRTARAKGLAEWRVLGRHVLRNAVIPMIPVLGLQAGYVLGGAVYVESIFQWPGIGRMLVSAISARDLLLVQGGVVVIATGYVLLNLLADLLQHWLDPRLR